MRHFEEIQRPPRALRPSKWRPPSVERPVWPANSEKWTERLAATFEQRILLERLGAPLTHVRL